MIALTANVVLTAGCGYCLSMALLMHGEDKALRRFNWVSRKVFMVFGAGLIGFSVYAAILLLTLQ